MSWLVDILYYKAVYSMVNIVLHVGVIYFLNKIIRVYEEGMNISMYIFV